MELVKNGDERPVLYNYSERVYGDCIILFTF
jgi:hypothetical protein